MINSLVQFSATLKSGVALVAISHRNCTVAEVRLFEYVPKQDLRRYSCLIDGVPGLITVDCGLATPLLSIGVDDFEIDHHIQEELIHLFGVMENPVAVQEPQCQMN
jgi:hypothetical protein